METNFINKADINHLVKLVSSGDWDAFLKLEKMLYKPLAKFLLRYCYNIDIVKDIISTTFCIVIEKSKSKMLYINCFGWIFSIAKRQMMKFLHKNSRIIFTDKTDFAITSYNLEKATLHDLIKQLDNNSQRLLFLIYSEKLPYKKIAKLMNISVSTVKRRHDEIKEYLKEQMTNEKD